MIQPRTTAVFAVSISPRSRVRRLTSTGLLHGLRRSVGPPTSVPRLRRGVARALITLAVGCLGAREASAQPSPLLAPLSALEQPFSSTVEAGRQSPRADTESTYENIWKFAQWYENEGNPLVQK